MRTRIVLFLVSSIVVFGCVRQGERYQLSHAALQDARASSVSAADKPCTDANPCVTVHEVILDGMSCPDTLRLGSRDIVKFSNRTGRPVTIFGLDNWGRRHTPKARDVNPAPTRVPLSGIYLMTLNGRDSLGYLQVSKNPEADSLIFDYNVRFTGADGHDLQCGFERIRKISTSSMSVPPSMIVGPDTL